jgi:hypothetical protein
MSLRVLIDQREFTAQPAATWADLLSQIEADLDARGDVISEVRFDGVELVNYRDDRALRRPLAEVDLIDIDAVPPQELIARGLREALGSIEHLQRGTRDLAIGYRRNEITESNQRLGVLAEAIGNLITIVGAARNVLGVDLSTTDVDGSVAAAIIGELDTAIAAMGEAAGARDWTTLADLLEFDVEPVLPRIARVIETLATIPLPRSR